MRVPRNCRAVVSALSTLALSILIGAAARAEEWPCWRGPRGDGTSLETGIPTDWDGPSGRNIAWKIPLPGHGHSSPIVQGDYVLLTSCVETSGDRRLLCIDRRDGKLLWQRTVVQTPLEKKHSLNSFASGTPATDGQSVFVTFLEPDFHSLTEPTPGNMVVAAYDFSGKLQWLVRPGRFSSRHGYCASPVVFKDKLIVNGDHDGDSYIVALDRATGKTLWKTMRENKTRSYVTPIIREIDGRTQMILSGSRCVASYDPNDGSRHWIIDGPTEQYVASLVYNGRLLFMTAGFPERHILAIRPDGHGNVTDTHVVWRTAKACSYVPSPIAAGPYFLVVSDSGIGSCFDGDTGERYWMERINQHASASLVSADGLVHFMADSGKTTIVRPGIEYDVVAENELGEECYASPAISHGRIFLRGVRHLYCVGKP